MDANEKHEEKDDNYTRMLHAVLNKSWKQHPTKQQLYGQLPPISQTIQVRQTKLVQHSWRSKDELQIPVLDDQQRPSYISYFQILDAVLKTYQE